jgi:hypothetical protein
VSLVDREEPEASRSEWHADGTAGENGPRLRPGGDGTSSGDRRGPSKATRASLASAEGVRQHRCQLASQGGSNSSQLLSSPQLSLTSVEKSSPVAIRTTIVVLAGKPRSGEARPRIKAGEVNFTLANDRAGNFPGSTTPSGSIVSIRRGSVELP